MLLNEKISKLKNVRYLINNIFNTQLINNLILEFIQNIENRQDSPFNIIEEFIENAISPFEDRI